MFSEGELSLNHLSDSDLWIISNLNRVAGCGVKKKRQGKCVRPCACACVEKREASYKNCIDVKGPKIRTSTGGGGRVELGCGGNNPLQQGLLTCTDLKCKLIWLQTWPVAIGWRHIPLAPLPASSSSFFLLTFQSKAWIYFLYFSLYHIYMHQQCETHWEKKKTQKADLWESDR